MIPCTDGPSELELFLFSVWFSICEFVIRWFMPEEIRGFCLSGDLAILQSSYPGTEYLLESERPEYEKQKAVIEKRYRITEEQFEESKL